MLAGRFSFFFLGLFGKIEFQGLWIIGPQGLVVAQFFLPILEQRREAFYLGLICWISRQVLDLVRVLGEIEELGLVDVGINDDFPALVADGSLDGPVGQEYRGAAAGGFFPKNRNQA